MLDTSSNPGEYQKLFWAKMMSFDLLAPAEQGYLLDHYLTYCQTHVFYLDRELAALADEAVPTVGDAANAALNALAAEVIRHHRGQWQFELDYVRQLRERLLAPVEGARQPGGEGASERG